MSDQTSAQISNEMTTFAGCGILAGFLFGLFKNTGPMEKRNAGESYDDNPHGFMYFATNSSWGSFGMYALSMIPGIAFFTVAGGLIGSVMDSLFKGSSKNCLTE